MVSFLGRTKVLVAGEAEQSPQIGVWVYNLAKISPAYLIEAEAEATKFWQKQA